MCVLQKLVNAKYNLLWQESWPLWEIILDFLSSNNSPKLVKMLEKGSTRQREISIPIKDFYIQWIGLTSGIQEVRQLYHRLQQLKPLSLQFYKTYLDLEETQSIKKVKFIRQGYEDAVNEYGGLNPDLWLDYIRFESTHGKPENAGVLYYRAIKNLTGDQNTDFISKHTLIQTGHLHTES
ncbi:hypothetical protein LOTGIDRAFT_235076 [Lottia gigantea]|uniref:U3 small nucleolar RNA-associated protein 6 homolog C-terminal domain-containing protein n=1 Tax=Lottia gigantea TaxID=225164 RepID=V3ZXR4_LOTGI|nr:hypothetical protein LOTGIDRAFT_235076 [Lottia gigantea]ESO87390.1 hypothetical protein LOTGIDRAFT_235076 [Lottia gigantea]